MKLHRATAVAVAAFAVAAVLGLATAANAMSSSPGPTHGVPTSPLPRPSGVWHTGIFPIHPGH